MTTGTLDLLIRLNAVETYGLNVVDLLIFECDKLSFANLKMQILQFCSADINDSIYQISSVYLISDSSGPIPEIHISHRL